MYYIMSRKLSSTKLFSYCCYFVCLCVLTIASAAHADSPKEFDNQYQTKLFGVTVKVTNRFSAIGANQYELLLQAEAALGSITETSRIYWDDEKELFVPLHYTYMRRSFGRRKTLALSFDWENQQVVNLTELKTWPLGTAENVQDKLSYQVQMQQDLLRGKQNFEYQVADKNGLQAYEFSPMGEESLDSALGQVDAVKLRRVHGKGKRVTTAWLAKEWGYLMMRLEHKEKGSTSVLDIQRASVAGKQIERKTNHTN
jgi:hypothetical protein